MKSSSTRTEPNLARGRRGFPVASRLHGDGGFVGGGEGMLLGVVVFVFGLLVMFNGWAVIDAKMAVSSAARESMRTLVESDGSTLAAATAGRQAFAAASNFDASGLSAPTFQGEFARCRRMTVSYEYTVPALNLPGGIGWGRGFDVSASHTEIVDPFRSGLEGEALCETP